ncbi:pyridoxamine 5'-phosphate oxidase family protein [Sphingomonas populi]|uniref:Pyridoxamine 5'-phosphate oxidase family protein n=1 Tax=Sphingomonas populi TaxID=2484750 RepID=A0A4Q6Y8F4_9SPHN|nr:pyridoxamine 5'-phosphate oxidase family protein [Sphingomonas populi]RZF66384.1 pyridoxamine 5'-phosphate oxidase family protein [Sphingomonas populi]
MAQTYLHTMFGPRARALQAAAGSRASYARMEANAGDADILTTRELDFITARDSVYMASVSEDGWPYVQHRGGPAGFLRRIAGNRIGFADYQGNRQYLSAANLAADDRVSLFLMDYPNRRRLKLIGHASSSDDPADIAALMVPDYAAEPERAVVIDVIGFDWNCPQHITPRFTEAEVQRATRPLTDELARLRARVAELEGLPNWKD